MPENAIQIRGISKKYRLGSRVLYHTLRESLSGAFGAMTRFFSGGSGDAPADFWALRDVSFDVGEGEVIGVIGHNGAGKSTLLKILSEITEPTAGEVTLRGRVASLLEVGTGFHPELTGRENVFMNGAILGMTRAEIRRKFDEIVSFAAVEKFLDTPVKRYSSGMYLRLAFAVAAHLEPEILLVDEVLAVGDLAFQRKCFAKMGEVASEGRTVLLVSHNLSQIARLCARAVWLDEGRVAALGPAEDVVRDYIERATRQGSREGGLRDRAAPAGSGEAMFTDVRLLDGDDKPTGQYLFGDDIRFVIGLDARRPCPISSFALEIRTDAGVPVAHLQSQNGGLDPFSPTGRARIEVVLPKARLYPGRYVGDLWMGDGRGYRIDHAANCFAFEIVESSAHGIRVPLNTSKGLVFCESRWTVKEGRKA